MVVKEEYIPKINKEDDGFWGRTCARLSEDNKRLKKEVRELISLVTINCNQLSTFEGRLDWCNKRNKILEKINKGEFKE